MTLPTRPLNKTDLRSLLGAIAHGATPTLSSQAHRKAQQWAIATYSIDFMRWRTLSSELERIILQITKPPFNARIPTRE